MCDGRSRDPVEGDCLVVKGEHVLALVNGQGAVRLAQKNGEEVLFCERKQERKKRETVKDKQNMKCMYTQ